MTMQGLMYPKPTKRKRKGPKTGPSILQNKKECFLTGRMDNLEKHHIFGGPRRDMSDEQGFWVWITADLHVDGTDGVHQRDGGKLKLWLKQRCEYEYLKTHTLEEWMALVKKNYILDEVDLEVAKEWNGAF